jgi:energy-coupling factor transport system ATP-binding protein
MIAVKNVSVQYQSSSGVVKALDSVTLNIGDGEYVAILGANGSGKSTLLKVICGFVVPSAGEIKLLDLKVRPGAFGEDYFGRVGVVLQEPEGQFIMRTVEAEIGAVLMNLGRPAFENEPILADIARRFGLESLLDRKPDSLSGGQMQITNMACAMAATPRLLLLDEPTTFLDPSWRERLLSYLDKLHEQGVTIVHVTQYPDEALRAARACILESGQIIDDGNPEGVFLSSRDDTAIPGAICFKRIFGFDWGNAKAAEEFAANIEITGDKQVDVPGSGHPVIELSELEFSHKASGFELKIDDLKLNIGGITGLVGPTGSGKTTLAYLMAGLYRASAGRILIDGRPIEEFDAASLARILGHSWQIADLSMIGPAVVDEVHMGSDDLPPEEMRALLANVMLEGYENRIVDTLSGGEKRKLSLAAILARKPRYLILDEPSAFLDPKSQNEIAAIIRRSVAGGRGALVIGHDLHFISEVADRILGMKDGRIIFGLPASEFFSDPKYCMELGVLPHPMIEFRRILQDRGLTLPVGTIDPAQMRHAIATLFA